MEPRTRGKREAEDRQTVAAAPASPQVETVRDGGSGGADGGYWKIRPNYGRTAVFLRSARCATTPTDDERGERDFGCQNFGGRLTDGVNIGERGEQNHTENSSFGIEASGSI